MGNQYTNNVSGGTVYGNVGHVEYHNGSTPQDEAILKELQELQQKVEEIDSSAAYMIGELRNAIEEQNQPKISTMIRNLTTGAIGSVIAELAKTGISAGVKQLLRLP